jgi:hypothetical protein
VKHRYQNPKFLYNYFLPEAGSVNWAWPHGEGVMVHNDKVYVMFGMSDPSKVIDYAPTEIVEFSRSLVPTGRKAVLSEGALPPTRIGKNALTMAMYDGKLYVGCIGGRQGPGVFGDIWEVDFSDMSARQVLDFEDVGGPLAGAGWGAYGIDFTDDGTAFILAGGYNPSMDFKGRLFRISAASLAAGGLTAVGALQTKYDFTNASGHSWWDGVTWDEKADTVWCMAGTYLFAFDKEGNVKRDFTPLILGEDIYSVALFNEPFPTGAEGTPEDPPVIPDQIDDLDVEIVQAVDLEIVDVSGKTVTDVVGELFDPQSTLPVDELLELESKFNINPAKQLEANAWAVEQGLGANDALALDQSSFTPLPVFSASITSGKTALVTIKTSLGRFAGNDFGKLTLLKLKKDGVTTDKLKKASGWQEMTDGVFIVTNDSGEPQSGVIENREYLVSIAIQDGGDYDWNTQPGEVIDPGVLALEGGANYEGQASGGGGMPGGCATGASGLLALLALAALCGRKRR